MKVLILVEDYNCAELLAKLPEVKVISESEIVSESPYNNKQDKVGYSTYVVSRAENLSKIYKTLIIFIIFFVFSINIFKESVSRNSLD